MKSRDDDKGGMRPPPQNLEAEQALLGALLLDPIAIAEVRSMVDVEALYRAEHRAIYEAICEVADAGQPSDIYVIEECLKRRQAYDLAGGRDYLVDLCQSVPSAANVLHYARICREKHQLRILLDIGYHLQQQAQAADAESGDLIRRVELRLMKEAGQIRQRRVMTAADGAALVNRVLEGKVERGLSTGFSYLDEKLGWLRNGGLYILAARPAVGKSAMALQIARHVAEVERVPVAYVSIEMGGPDLIQRMITQQLAIDGDRFVNPQNLTESERSALQAYVYPDNLYIVDASGIEITELRAEARRFKMEWGIGLLVVDYLGLVKDPASAKQTQAVMVGNVSTAIKGIARELDIPILAIHSVNRGNVQDNKIPDLHNIRDSGQIEHDADAVVLLHCAAQYSDKVQLPPEIEVCVKVAKNRHGPTGMRSHWFARSITAFNVPDPARELAAATSEFGGLYDSDQAATASSEADDRPF